MNYLGKNYVLVKTENFDEFLKFIGISFFQRKIAATLKPVQSLSQNEDGTFSFRFNSSVSDNTIVFKPGVEFVEERANGTKVNAVITVEDDKMIHIQKDKNKKIQHVVEFFDEKLLITTTANGFNAVTKRHFVSLT